MIRKYTFCCFLLIVINQLIFAQGTRVDTSFFSQSLQIVRLVDIYLPEDYDPAEDIDYPVIYFLHGAGGNQNSYPEIINILDTLIAGEYIQPTIVVKPSGLVGPYAGSMWTNSELYGDFEDFVIYDLIEFVESSYNVISDRNYRCITGHSMGGIGCMKIALAHPDKYKAVAALSGALDLNVGIDLWLPHIMAENGENPPYNYSPFGGTFSLLTFTAAGAFTPNLSNLPYFIDFPLDSDGNIIDSVYQQWLPHNPANMASSLPPDHELAIYFDCGTYDHLEFYPMATAFAETLTNLGIEYQFQSFFGDHYSETRPPVAFMFLDSVMNSTTGIDKSTASLPEDICLSQNYPNPFNANTEISYLLSEPLEIHLEIFNVLGQSVEILCEGIQQAGEHSVSWNADQYPSGIYFAKLTADHITESIKMVLLK